MQQVERTMLEDISSIETRETENASEFVVTIVHSGFIDYVAPWFYIIEEYNPCNP